MRKKLSEKDIYLSELFKFKNKTLLAISDRLERDDKLGINIGYHEVSILKFFIQQFNVKSILEIGTLYGFSTYAMAASMPKDGHITSLEKNTENFAIAKELLSASDQFDKIKLYNEDALKFLQNDSSKYDLIFIDANKSGYEKYLDLSLKLLTDKGMIIGDNTFLFGNVYNQGSMKVSDKNTAVMQNFNKKLIDDKNYSVTIIPTTEGMTLIKACP